MPFSWALVIELKGREVAVTKAIGSARDIGLNPCWRAGSLSHLAENAHYYLDG